jgi:glycosyltransferase involved in cell wall biosynthesis
MRSATTPDLVSVVLCSHNGAGTLPDQLAALASQDYPGAWELVFVDDRSTDASVSIAESWSDRLPIRIVSTAPAGDPVGLARARNVGGHAARGDVLLFCDDDDVADPAWITSFAQAAPESTAFGGYIEEELLNDRVARDWRFAWTPGRLPTAFDRVEVPLGGNSGVWSSAFREVGGFDSDLSYSGEEVDFYWRLQLAGHDVRYVPDAVMHVRHRGGLRALARQSYRYGLGNAAVYARFHHLGLPRTSARQTLGVVAKIARGVPKALVSRRKRGAWLRMTSFACGQAMGSARHRVWHLD